ncbi:MAG: HEPN domain-containing protein [Mangrovibacterium sp.]|nr:HEPN domain-containing protein [Mangrovibacterium sp.]
MQNEGIDIEKTINHWITRSDQDFETMIHLYHSKDYHWALFMGHLVIERLLKAGVVRKTKTYAPFTHDLRRLAKLSGIDFNDEQKRWLDTTTTFNLNARYDDYKQDFYERCTPEFTEIWVSTIKILREWIKQKL